MKNPSATHAEFAPRSGARPQSLVIALHGYGANGDDLIDLAPMLAAHLPNTYFLSPHAPTACEMSPQGRQWFSLRDWSPAAMLKGAEAAAAALNQFIDAQLAHFELGDDSLGLIGFSQGTMMALYVALRRAKPCAGVVGFSGALVGEAGVTVKPPVCLIHGTMDGVVPFGAMALAEATLKRQGVPVQTHVRPGLAHSIDPQGLGIAVAFLKDKGL